MDRVVPRKRDERINEEIRAPARPPGRRERRTGRDHPTKEALEFAYGKGLDLVEVAAGADPPVARVMDYSKYRYEQEQRAKQARKHQLQIQIKEIKLRPKIGNHDYETKKGRRALSRAASQGQGHDHVPRARDAAPGTGSAHAARGGRQGARLDRAAAVLDGRNMVMVLGPNKNVEVKTDAKDEDVKGEEALQGDGGGEAPAPARDEEPQPREEVVEA